MQREIFAVSPSQSPQSTIRKKISPWFDEDALPAQCQALQPGGTKLCTHAHTVRTAKQQQPRGPSLGFSLGSRSRIYSTKGRPKQHKGSTPPK